MTYNRKDLLRECLDRLAAQSRPPDRVLVVDNASTDGTDALLAERTDVEPLRMARNGGGAGGFESGLREARRAGYDWYWLLDDDTLADAGCLEALLAGSERAPLRPQVMTSAVRWKDGRLHPMNRPWLRTRDRGGFALGASAGLAPIRAATFVSTMVHRDAIDRHGLPHGEYFIWLDDIEYTGRILREGHGYIVPESHVCHWTPRAYDTATDTRERFYFKVRNHLWLLRGPSFGGLERAQYARSLAVTVTRYLRASRPRRRALAAVARGLRDGLGRQVP